MCLRFAENLRNSHRDCEYIVLFNFALFPEFISFMGFDTRLGVKIPTTRLIRTNTNCAGAWGSQRGVSHIIPCIPPNLPQTSPKPPQTSPNIPKQVSQLGRPRYRLGALLLTFALLGLGSLVQLAPHQKSLRGNEASQPHLEHEGWRLQKITEDMEIWGDPMRKCMNNYEHVMSQVSQDGAPQKMHYI